MPNCCFSHIPASNLCSRAIQDPAKGGEAGESTEVAVRVRFDEEQGFEPPQGSLEIIEVRNRDERMLRVSPSARSDFVLV